MEGSGKLTLFNLTLSDYALSDYYVPPVEPEAAPAIPVKPHEIEEDAPLSAFGDYSVLPTEFIDMATWTKSVNVLCVYCGQPIAGVPIPIIHMVDSTQTPYRYKVHRLTCSPTCMHNAIIEIADPAWDSKQNVLSYSNMVLKIISGCPAIEAPAGLNRNLLCAYAGAGGMPHTLWQARNAKTWAAALSLMRRGS